MHFIAQCCNIIKRKLLSKLEVQRLNELDVAQSPILTDQSTKLSKDCGQAQDSHIAKGMTPSAHSPIREGACTQLY